jgi:hypothetical protein
VPTVSTPPSTAAPEAAVGPATQEAAAPTFGGGIPIRSVTGDHVTKATVLVWYLVAIVFGALVAGLSWARAEGHLNLVALLRRR